jgi:hypothetical protein
MVSAVSSVSAVKATAIADLGVLLDNAGEEGVFFWTTGDFTGQADDLFIIQSNHAAISSGAWVRQQSASVSFRQNDSGAVTRRLQDRLAETVSAWDFMDAVMIAEVQSYTRTADVTGELQTALDEAWATNRDLYIPAGLYPVTGLTLPGNADSRHKAFKVIGQGTGEIFVRPESVLFNGGTILKSETDAPILEYTPDVEDTGSGNVEICYIRFEGDSTTPVVQLGSFFIQSEFHHNAIYQAGTGNGFESQFTNTAVIHHNYCLNRDWNPDVPVMSRTGIGFYIWNTHDAGLTDLHNNTSRGFRTGYKLGDGSETRIFSPKISHCECSVNYDGIVLTQSIQGALIEHNYLEGGDGGTGLLDLGRYNKFNSNFVFSGYANCLDGSNAGTGASYCSNTLVVGERPSTTAVQLTDGCEFRGNSIVFNGSGESIANVIGVVITGASPRIAGLGDNDFDPSGAWVGGAGTTKILDLSTGGGIIGFSLGAQGNDAMPLVSRGGISYYRGNTLGDASISSTTLNLPDGRSYFPCSFTTTGQPGISRLEAGELDGRVIELRLDSNVRSIVDSAYIFLDGGTTFTGPGLIRFVVERAGGASYAYEASRTSY